MPTALITGGHSGIGLSAARTLASRYKWDLVLAGRSPASMEKVAEALRREFGIGVTLVSMDTSSLQSVRNAASQLEQLLADGDIPSLDAILCNAGGRVDGPVQFSADGFEMTFAANCLGHFLLTNRLVGHIAAHGRIVFTASGTHDPDTIDGRLVGTAVEPDADVLALIGKPGHDAVSVGKRYSTSKLSNILNAYELDRRLRTAGSTISVIAFDPGSVPATGLTRGLPAPVRSLMRSAFMRWVSRRIGVTVGSVEFSGASLAALAADPAFADMGGRYFQCNDGKLAVARSSAVSYDQTRAVRLWQQMSVLARLDLKDDNHRADDTPEADSGRRQVAR